MISALPFIRIVNVLSLNTKFFWLRRVLWKLILLWNIIVQKILELFRTLISGLDGTVFSRIYFDHSLFLHVVPDFFKTGFNLSVSRLIHDHGTLVDIWQIGPQDYLVQVLRFAASKSRFSEIAGIIHPSSVFSNVSKLTLSDIRIVKMF